MSIASTVLHPLPLALAGSPCCRYSGGGSFHNDDDKVTDKRAIQYLHDNYLIGKSDQILGGAGWYQVLGL